MPSVRIKQEDVSDWDPEDSEPRAPVLRGQPEEYSYFMLRNDKFTVLGHERECAARILDYMSAEQKSERLAGLDKEEVTAAIKGLNRKRFFYSQLIHHGIFKRKNMTPTEDYTLKNTLLPLVEEAVQKNWFDQVPTGILRLERRMRKDIQDEHAKYLRHRTKWDWHVQKQKADAAHQREVEENATWDGLRDNPGQRANVNIARFFKEYFLTDGRLDPSKTPQALRLDDVTNGKGKEVVSRAKALGLSYYITPQYAHSIICLGFDMSGVKELSDQICEDVNKKAERIWAKGQKALWQQDVQEHLILAGQLCQQKVDEFGDSYPTWKLRHCSGLYAIRSDKIIAQYPQHLRNSMRISAKLVRTPQNGLALVASYDFGVCSGTMYLAESAETLNWLTGGGDRDMDADSDEEPSPANTSRKRRNPITGQHSAHKRRRQSSGPVESTQDKPSLTLLVTFRGRKTVGGDHDIFHIPKNGKIDFYDDYHCRMKGNIDLPGLGYVSFEGWKTQRGVKGMYEPRPWGAFSGAAYRGELKHRERQRQQRENAALGTRERPLTIL
ncbi:hypothetical protein GE09DRAFT_1248287 [Coniochaeta sp. 2T2.1]|nr:hypothetical protein GE09DRAFT_1248287 [Coniochaeta sp. 2T2.1]